MGFDDAQARWNERYQREDYLFGTEPNAWLRAHAHLWQSGQRVLCVADGEGRNSVWLARQGLQVDAFDISPVAAEKAQRLAHEARVSVRFDVSGCDQWDWPENTYDGVAAIFVQFADPAMRARLFAHITHALKPGGLLVLQGYTPRQLEYKTGGPPELSHLYTQALLREELAHMDILELREYEDDIAEGSGHCGRSALAGMVARKRAQ